MAGRADASTTDSSSARALASGALVLALAAAVWFQRGLLGEALGQIGGLSLISLGALIVLTVYERWSRADIMRRLLNGSLLPADGGSGTTTGDVSIGGAVVIHDVGNAVSKAIPLGGALGTAIRWTIAKGPTLSAPRFATTLVAYGIATTFASWLLPFMALGVDLSRRNGDAIDWLLLGGIGAVVVASGLFWLKVLGSDGLERWSTVRLRALWQRAGRRVRSLDAHDPAAGVAEVRGELRLLARHPWRLMALTLLSQACGSLILLVALRSLGVGAELGNTEFFRIFFLVTLLGSFAPTPGGLGAIEAGLTGALVAAGVETSTALAGVIVYRFLVYLVPIIVGAVAYGVWRAMERRTAMPDVLITSVGTV